MRDGTQVGARGEQHARCAVCGRSFRRTQLVPAAVIRPALAETIARGVADWSDDALICHPDLNRFRSRYVQNLLEQEMGELSEIERSVVERITERETLATNVDERLDEKETLGERVADRVAEFGGSWTLHRLVRLRDDRLDGPQHAGCSPRALRSLSVHPAQSRAVLPRRGPGAGHHDEPEPAGGARPARADNDYLVNLKAELEIRLLHEKLDHLLRTQCERLMEIQQIQIELMQDLRRR